MTKGFEAFGKGLVFMISVGLVIGIFQEMTGVMIFRGEWEMLPVTDGFATVVERSPWPWQARFLPCI